ncbi:MAG: hypothetical protein LQ352_008118 [Teloschistes flavicans]|nr:MAG: hypothetical protein LQ352_008118 [Teloschistes flavicans]
MYIFKKLTCLCTLLFVSALVNCAPTPNENVRTAELQRRSARYPSVDQRLFNINGKTQYFAGTNTWWLGHLFSNDDVDLALSQIAATGYKVTRVWAFGTTNNPATETNVYFQTLNSSGQHFNYNTRNGIARLDYALAAAEQRGIKLILPLLNNFDALGGINTYTTVYGGTHQQFYTNAAAQAAYKKYIKFIVQRYKSSTAIFSWELCNEPRCSGCSPDIIYNWAKDTSAYIKQLDKNHMVSLGDEGWLTATSAASVPNYEQSYAYTGYEGVDFERNLAIPTLDYGTVHPYPNQWGYNYTWGSTWIEQHNVLGKAAGKPVIMEEYAVPDGEDRVGIMGAWQATIVNKTSLAGDMVWQFGTALPSGANPFDNYAVYYGSGEYGVLGTAHAKAMSGKNGKASPLVATG